MVGHVAPEAYVGGPIALVKNDDEITIDTETNSIDLHVSTEELENRKKQWKKPEPNYLTGALAKYATLVGSAANGAITIAKSIVMNHLSTSFIDRRSEIIHRDNRKRKTNYAIYQITVVY